MYDKCSKAPTRKSRVETWRCGWGSSWAPVNLHDQTTSASGNWGFPRPRWFEGLTVRPSLGKDMIFWHCGLSLVNNNNKNDDDDDDDNNSWKPKGRAFFSTMQSFAWRSGLFGPAGWCWMLTLSFLSAGNFHRHTPTHSPFWWTLFRPLGRRLHSWNLDLKNLSGQMCTASPPWQVK